MKTTVVLTGPTSGLGRALLDRLARLEYPLVAVGRDLRRIASVVERAKGAIHCVEFDFASMDYDAMLDHIGSATATAAIGNSADYLVFINNAGEIGSIGAAAQLPTAAVVHALRINCLSPLAVSQTLTRVSAALHKKLLIINVSTGAAAQPIKAWLAYCTSKSACKMALDVLASESPHIDLVHFDPGIIDTKMQNHIRNQLQSVMPDVETFRAFKAEGLIKAPSDVAAQIIDLMIDLTS